MNHQVRGRAVVFYNDLYFPVVILVHFNCQGPNNVPADVVFIVRQKSHPLFKRQDDDLLYMMQISLEMVSQS